MAAVSAQLTPPPSTRDIAHELAQSKDGFSVQQDTGNYGTSVRCLKASTGKRPANMSSKPYIQIQMELIQIRVALTDGVIRTQEDSKGQLDREQAIRRTNRNLERNQVGKRRYNDKFWGVHTGEEVNTGKKQNTADLTTGAVHGERQVHGQRLRHSSFTNIELI